MTSKINFLIIINFLISALSLNAQALFEVKDASDNTVLEVSNDGLRIFNEGDTLMVISSSEIKAFVDASAKDKGLSRSFSVSTSATGKGGGDVVNIDVDGLRVYNDNDKLMDITGTNITAYIDSNSTKGLSRSFSVSTSATGKAGVDVLEVSTGATRMREGEAGEHYTDFSPENMFLGLNAGESTDGVNNLFIGNSSGFSNLNGGNNVYIGTESGYFSENTYQNTYVGYRSGYNMTGASNTIIGSSAGADAGGTTNNTFVGSSAGMYASGGNNTFFGNNVGYAMATDNTGTRNTYIGQSAGARTTSGSRNVIMGFNAGEHNSSGSYNTIIGYLAGEGSYGISYSGNVFLGSFAGTNETASDRLYIDNSNTLTPLIYGEFDNDVVTINGTLGVTGNTTINGLLSIKTLQIADLGSANLGLDGDVIPYNGSAMGFDLGNNTATEHWDDIVGDDFINYAVKNAKDIKSIDSGLSKIMQLRPIAYKSDRRKFGLLADEVEKVIPEAVVSQDIDIDSKTGEKIIAETEKGMVYNQLIPVLIKSIQEQQVMINKKQEYIEKLETRLERIEKILNKL